MRALDLATRALRWAADPTGQPPQGELDELASLGSLDATAAAALGGLAAQVAARLRLDLPPLGDALPPGPGAAWLAAAVGAKHMAVASGIVEAAPTGRTAWDLLARHGIAAPALSVVPELLAESLRRASPLTGLLTRPAEGEADHAVALADRLRGVADGARLLVATLSAPTEDTAALAFRGDLLERLRGADRGGQAFVLDVFEAAVHHHGAAWSGAVERAMATLADRRASEPALQRALATARLWEPLRRVHRNEHDRVRERPLLDFYVYLPALRLAEAGARMSAQ